VAPTLVRTIPKSFSELDVFASASSQVLLLLNDTISPGLKALLAAVCTVSTVPLYFISVHESRIVPLLTEVTPSSADAVVDDKSSPPAQNVLPFIQ
jgi:hypothetical protein